MNYITLVGHVQSGKTNEEINFCYRSVNYHNIPVIFIVRNITADQNQLQKRFKLFGNSIKYTSLKTLTIETGVTFLKNNGVIILLCNHHQLSKVCKIIEEYDGKYNLCIDEVDFSIKTKNKETITDYYMDILKKSATSILGATATPVAVFSTQPECSVIKKLNPNTNYKGLSSLNVEFVNSIISTNNPRSDYGSIKNIYSSCLSKDFCILLHNIYSKKHIQQILASYLLEKFPEFTTIVYNGDGITVRCKNKITKFTKPLSVNSYGVLKNKYYIVDNIHYFKNYEISEVLQILKDDPDYKHTHISIIAGCLASRGISFVSTDYKWHLTDQYYHPSNDAHGENILQSLRILGCYTDDVPLTLWCHKGTWNDILEQNELITKLVNNCENNTEWLCNIQKVILSKPEKRLTRKRLINTTWNKLDIDKFTLKIS